MVGWLKQFNEVPVGSGALQFEEFTMREIKSNL